MKFIKHLFPSLINASGLQSSPGPNQTQVTQPLPPLRKKALLIGVQYKSASEPNASGPHHNVLEMKLLLMNVYNYHPKDITVLIDDDDPDHIQPTKENMIRKMIELVDGAIAGDRFFFYFSGYTMVRPTDNLEYEDNEEPFLFSLDGEVVTNDLLKKLLVEPLPIGTALVAIFDCCHSVSFLKLKHFRCNRVYTPWLNKGYRRTDFVRNIIMRHNARIDVSLRSGSPPGTFDHANIRTKSKKSLFISSDSTKKESWYGSTMSPIDRCDSPEPMYCTGNCRDNPSEEGLSADIISLSSSKNGQLSWEGPDGWSMTQVLIKVLKNNPHPSLKDLLTLISHDIHVEYVSMHGSARNYKEQLKNVNYRRQQKGKLPFRRQAVEMDNFQNPQIASQHPLDMNRRWDL